MRKQKTWLHATVACASVVVLAGCTSGEVVVIEESDDTDAVVSNVADEQTPVLAPYDIMNYDMGIHVDEETGQATASITYIGSEPQQVVYHDNEFLTLAMGERQFPISHSPTSSYVEAYADLTPLTLVKDVPYTVAVDDMDGYIDKSGEYAVSLRVAFVTDAEQRDTTMASWDVSRNLTVE